MEIVASGNQINLRMAIRSSGASVSEEQITSILKKTGGNSLKKIYFFDRNGEMYRVSGLAVDRCSDGFAQAVRLKPENYDFLDCQSGRLLVEQLEEQDFVWVKDAQGMESRLPRAEVDELKTAGVNKTPDGKYFKTVEIDGRYRSVQITQEEYFQNKEKIMKGDMSLEQLEGVREKIQTAIEGSGAVFRHPEDVRKVAMEYDRWMKLLWTRKPFFFMDGNGNYYTFSAVVRASDSKLMNVTVRLAKQGDMEAILSNPQNFHLVNPYEGLVEHDAILITSQGEVNAKITGNAIRESGIIRITQNPLDKRVYYKWILTPEGETWKIPISLNEVSELTRGGKVKVCSNLEDLSVGNQIHNAPGLELEYRQCMQWGKALVQSGGEEIGLVDNAQNVWKLSWDIDEGARLTPVFQAGKTSGSGLAGAMQRLGGNLSPEGIIKLQKYMSERSIPSLSFPDHAGQMFRLVLEPSASSAQGQWSLYSLYSQGAMDYREFMTQLLLTH